jgi:predicted RNA-binding protein with RPS1 domain
VDIPRKRIALSIKQATEAPKRPENTRNKGQEGRGNYQGARDKVQDGKHKFQANKPKENTNSEKSMNDALNALKKKFGK